MSFSVEHRTLRNGNTYNLKPHPDMSAHEYQSAAASELNAVVQSNETALKFSPELLHEKIKTNLEPLHAQIPALTQMMDKLTQDNSLERI